MQALRLQPGRGEGRQHPGQLLGAVAHHKAPAVPQKAGRTGGGVLKGAGLLVAGGGPGGVRADMAAGKIGRVAGRQMKLPGLGRSVGAQVGVNRLNVPGRLGLGRQRRRQQAVGRPVQLHRDAGATVALIVPAQGHNAAAAAQVGGQLVPAGAAEVRQKHSVGAEAVPAGQEHAGAVGEGLTGGHGRSPYQKRRTEGTKKRRPRKGTAAILLVNQRRAGTYSCSIAPVGQAPAQVPQSTQALASISYWLSP